MRFTSTPRGARLARRLVSHRLDQWGSGDDSATNETLPRIAAELCAKAVRYGYVPGRDFHIRLTGSADMPRVEVSDTRTERVPLLSTQEPPGDAESGRGLLLVSRLPPAGAPYRARRHRARPSGPSTNCPWLTCSRLMCLTASGLRSCREVIRTAQASFARSGFGAFAGSRRRVKTGSTDADTVPVCVSPPQFLRAQVCGYSR